MTDFVLAVFPWVLIWNLQMRFVEKLGVCICMSMGLLYVLFSDLTAWSEYHADSLRPQDPVSLPLLNRPISLPV